MEYFLKQFYNLNSFLFRILEEASTTKIAWNGTLGEANYNTANEAIILLMKERQFRIKTHNSTY